MQRLWCVIWIVSALPAAPAAPSSRSSGTERRILWRNPGAVEKLDFAAGAGGRSKAPKPPFTFVEENLHGSNPKVQVRDAAGANWNVKWGDEIHAEVFATRLAWACGYTVEPMYFVKSGRILNVGKLTRAKYNVASDGAFINARFELWDKSYKFVNKPGWTWEDNPFLRTKELNGLKIIMMLVSNWDNKDARDSGRDSNTAELVSRHGPKRIYYFITDWGASMGKWGRVHSRDKWDCHGFTEQTPHFVKGVNNNVVEWGYHGQHTKDAVEDISVADVRWLLRYLGRIRDQQIRQGLRASGATPEEVDCFTAALRGRINQLKSVARLHPSVHRNSATNGR